MKNTEKYISQPLAKKIAEVAREKKFELPESEEKFFPMKETTDSVKPHHGSKYKKDIFYILGKERDKYVCAQESVDYPIFYAYDVPELGEELPNGYMTGKVKGESEDLFATRDKRLGQELGLDKKINTDFTVSKNMAESMGKMYLYLLENNLL